MTNSCGAEGPLRPWGQFTCCQAQCRLDLGRHLSDHRLRRTMSLSASFAPFSLLHSFENAGSSRLIVKTLHRYVWSSETLAATVADQQPQTRRANSFLRSRDLLPCHQLLKLGLTDFHLAVIWHFCKRNRLQEMNTSLFSVATCSMAGHSSACQLLWKHPKFPSAHASVAIDLIGACKTIKYKVPM